MFFTDLGEAIGQILFTVSSATVGGAVASVIHALVAWFRRPKTDAYKRRMVLLSAAAGLTVLIGSGAWWLFHEDVRAEIVAAGGTVSDLGVMVSWQDILKSAADNDADMIGLSRNRS